MPEPSALAPLTEGEASAFKVLMADKTHAVAINALLHKVCETDAFNLGLDALRAAEANGRRHPGLLLRYVHIHPMPVLIAMGLVVADQPSPGEAPPAAVPRRRKGAS